MLNLRAFGIVLIFLIYTAMVVSVILIIKKRWFFKLIDVVVALALVVVLLFVAGPITQPVKAANSDVKTEIITVEGGQIQGLVNEDGDVDIYAGIPYAKAPVGDLRWKEPQDVEAWQGVKDCSYFAPKAMQAPNDCNSTSVGFLPSFLK